MGFHSWQCLCVRVHSRNEWQCEPWRQDDLTLIHEIDTPIDIEGVGILSQHSRLWQLAKGDPIDIEGNGILT